MNLKKTILITGIGGFVGLRAAELAIAQGFKVRGLQRSADKAKKAQRLGAEVFIDNVTNPDTARKACQGVDVVLHTAAVVREGGSLDYFRETNVDGTVNIAKAAKNAGVKTFVHLSSIMVYGFNYNNWATEEEPLNSDNNPYCQTKIEAEKELLKLNNPPDFGIIVIRPGDVYGPRSTFWVVRPLLLMRRRLFVLASGGQGVINHLYIDNLIDAIFLAVKKETHGEIFNITDGQETSWKQYFTRLAAIEGLPAPFSMPANLLKFLLRLRNIGQHIFHKQVDILLLPESINFISRPYACSIAKAQNLLGYKPQVNLEKGMRRTQDWLRKIDLENWQ